jgi:hypothetical protein
MADQFALETPEVHIAYKRGDSRAIVFQLTNAVTGAALDLTGWTVPVLAVDSKKDPTDELTQLFKVTGTISSPPTDGQIAFSPTTVQTDETPGNYFYDAQALDSSGGLLTFVEGKFKLTQDITKD